MKLRYLLAAIAAAGTTFAAWISHDERFGRPDAPQLTQKPHLARQPDWDPPRYVDTLNASFALCDGPVRANCVVDGDTFWFRGDKIRVADIDAPEIFSPHCPAERQVGDLARDRLLALLNDGEFSLTAGWRDEDRYGRKLRTIWRSGKSLGEHLVEEGLARRWDSPWIDWCGFP